MSRQQVDETKQTVLDILNNHGIVPHEETWEGNVCLLWVSTPKLSGVILLFPSQKGDAVSVALAGTVTTFSSRDTNDPEFLLEGMISKLKPKENDDA